MSGRFTLVLLLLKITYSIKDIVKTYLSKTNHRLNAELPLSLVLEYFDYIYYCSSRFPIWVFTACLCHIKRTQGKVIVIPWAVRLYVRIIQEL